MGQRPSRRVAPGGPPPDAEPDLVVALDGVVAGPTGSARPAVHSRGARAARRRRCNTTVILDSVHECRLIRVDGRTSLDEVDHARSSITSRLADGAAASASRWPAKEEAGPPGGAGLDGQAGAPAAGTVRGSCRHVGSEILSPGTVAESATHQPFGQLLVADQKTAIRNAQQHITVVMERHV